MWLMLVEALFALGLLMFIVWWTMATPRETESGVHEVEAGNFEISPPTDRDTEPDRDPRREG